MITRPVVCVVDCETSGVAHADRVIEVACIVADGAGEVLAATEGLVRPPDLAELALHEKGGITYDMLETAPTFAEVAEFLYCAMTMADQWVGFGLAFDLRFLGAEFSRLGLSLPIRTQQDLLRSFPRQTLEVTCRNAGVTVPQDYPWHRAFADVVATFRLWRKIVSTGMVGEGVKESVTMGLRVG